MILKSTCTPLPTQRKIAAILSAYDDLIENNTRRIKILEEMAQALYREWFVKFRFPGHEKVKMVESELGMVPEGWEIKKATDAIYINPTTKVPKEGEKPFVSMGNNWQMIRCNVNPDFEYRSSFEIPVDQNSKIGDVSISSHNACLENGKTVYVQIYHRIIISSSDQLSLWFFVQNTLCSEFVYLIATLK